MGLFETEIADGVLTIRWNRPDALNSLRLEMYQGAAEHVRAAADDPSVRVVVLTGTGRAFSAGADIAQDRPEGPERLAPLEAGNALVEAIIGLPKPVVAAVNGLAAGIGATIALACDLVIAKSSSYFLLAFANIGLMPDGGATLLVPAAIGRARAARMALLGERIPAATALDWGLVSHVVDDADFDTEVSAVVTKLSQGPTQSYARTKAALAASTLALLKQTHALECAGQDQLFDTADFAEGVAAFREKRPARFTGR